MLQDFLTGRAALASETSTPPALARGSSDFQPMNPARFGQLGAPEPESAPGEAAPRLDAPLVEVIEDGGRVRRIVVTCRCCEKIEIDCEY